MTSESGTSESATFAAGWYPHPDDPEGTVRRWNGDAWIGYPIPMPTEEPEQLGLDEADRPTAKRRPLPRQGQIIPFAVLGGLGLLITIALAIDLILELVEVYQNFANLTVEKSARVRALNDPFHNPASQRFGIAVLIGGFFFLVWLRSAHRNLGRPIRGSQAGAKSWLFLGFVVTILRWVVSPIVSMMFDLVEHSGSGPDSGKISPGGPIAWWVLWLSSAYFIVLTLLVLWAKSDPASIGVLGLVIGALIAHVVSLVLALRLLIQITIFQERRLALVR